MKHVVRKAYWDFEKEEKWINEMCAKGMHLVNYTWCKYTFEDGEQGEYIYRLELLENPPNHDESAAYIKFLEESGVEHVTSYQCWIYLRKLSSEGDFEVYSDVESKLKYYKRVNGFWMLVAVANLVAGITNINLAATLNWVNEMGKITYLNIIGGTLCLILGLFLLLISHPLRKKIRQLKTDSDVIE